MTHLHDLPTHTIINYSLLPAQYESGDTGNGVDLVEGDGPAFALASVFASVAADPVAITLEESNDQSTWTAVTNGDFPNVTVGQDRVLLRKFTRTKRYVRAKFENDDDLSANIAVYIGQQRKTV